MARTVAVEPTAFPLKITISGGTSTGTTNVKVVNRTTREFQTVRAQSNTAIVDLINLSSDGTNTGTISGFSNGQVMDIRCSGARTGSSTYTLATADRSKGGGKATVTLVDITAGNTPAVSV